jgi:hypothetical protein
MRPLPRLALVGGAVLLAAGGSAVPALAGPSALARIVRVSTGAELERAMADARPGDTIRLADGTYRAEAFTTVSGTARAPITLTGSRRAVIVNDHFVPSTTPCPSGHTAYGVWLNGASWWNLTGFTVAYSKKGIVLDRASHVRISGVLVHDIQDEGVHFRKSTTDSSIVGSTIHTTGLVQKGFGEGVYIGSAFGNWRCYGENGPGTPDRSDRIQVIGNRFGPNIAAEHVDIKEGTVDGTVIGNFFDGRGLTGANSADSWIDAKGSRYEFTGNFGFYTQTPGSVFANGYEVHEQYLQGYGCANVFRGNFSDLGGVGKLAVEVNTQDMCLAKGEPNVVYADNVVTRATVGLTNIPTS